MKPTVGLDTNDGAGGVALEWPSFHQKGRKRMTSSAKALWDLRVTQPRHQAYIEMLQSTSPESMGRWNNAKTTWSTLEPTLWGRSKLRLGQSKSGNRRVPKRGLSSFLVIAKLEQL